MGLEEKKQVVKEVREKIGKSNSLCFTNFKGLTASKMNELRRSLEDNDAELKVFKNRLIKRALEEDSLKELVDFIEGPVALVFGYDDPILPVKVISDFRKEEDLPVVNGGYLDGKSFDGKSFLELAAIPSKDELYGKIVGSLSSPLNSLVFILSGVPRKLITILSEIAREKEE